MNVNKFSVIIKTPIFIIIIFMVAIAVVGGRRVIFYLKSPNVVFLSDRAAAQWIRYDSEFELEAKKTSKNKCEFKKLFYTSSKIDNASITVQALKSCQILFDGINIFSSNYEFNEWKKVQNIKLPFTVNSGPHEIIIIVTSENSYPAVIAYSKTLPINTGEGWFASNDGKNWRLAIPASQIKQLALAKDFPSSIEALVALWPYLSTIFVIVMFISLFASWNNDKWQKFLSWWSEPSRIKWFLLFLWAVLSANNMLKLNYQVGTDGWGHIEYIDYIVTKLSLPLATEGWQMFQPPLNYILSAPLYALVIRWFDFSSIVKIMGIVPFICGLLQIEIVYRISRLVFADRKDLQIIAVIAGSLLPIHTYVCQYVGNEPLVACFVSLLVFFCISLIMPDQKERQSGYFVLIGFIWGLALLSKASAIVLAPLLIIVIVFYVKLIQKPLSSFLKSVAIVFGVSTLLAGWYYFRNYIKLGSPFAGILDNLQMQFWWQDPSYRTWSQILSFGSSLKYPVYSGVTSFWDTLYSTLWLDGINSGSVDFIAWNEKFMIAGALLALLPSLFIMVGVISAWRNKKKIYRNAVIFSAGTVALFVVAMMDVYIVRQAYSVTKASYTLGLLPCYAILIAAGADPFLHNKVVRSFALAFFACWAFAAYIAYFVIKFQ